MSVLFVVGTPIGNLGDITFRAVETFKKVDIVAAEDTRHTLQLLNHLGIKKPMISCRAQNEVSCAQKIIKILDDGQTIAYASDAGTPGISDPGGMLAKLARNAGHNVVPIPGVSAFTSLVSVAGLRGKNIVFAGFLSTKAGKRRSEVRKLLAQGEAAVLYESPHRIVKLLSDIADTDNKRRVVIGRELTKMHEEIIEGTADEMKSEFASRKKNLGEFTIFISGNKNTQLSEESADN